MDIQYFLQYFLIFPWTFEEMSKIDHHNLYLSIHYLLLHICSRKTNINFTKYHWNLVNNIKESSLCYTNPTKETVKCNQKFKSWSICSTNYQITKRKPNERMICYLLSFQRHLHRLRHYWNDLQVHKNMSN